MSAGKKALTALLFSVLAVLFASPASAATTIPINPGNVPTTAEKFGGGCDQLPGGASATEDGWVFVLPGNKGTFLSVTATFKDTAGATHTVSATILTGNGTSKAWARTPQGWTLTGATASIDGSAPHGTFNLTHACPATGGTTPSPSTPATSDTPGTPGPSGSTGPSESPGATPSSSGTPGTPGATTTPPAPTTSPASGNLPITGTALTWVLVAGVALAAAGGALLIVRRRRASSEY